MLLKNRNVMGEESCVLIQYQECLKLTVTFVGSLIDNSKDWERFPRISTRVSWRLPTVQVR